MKIAWFRPGPPSGGFDDLAAVISGLSPAHTVHVIDEPHAHDFPWMWARGAFDLCVYEVDNTAAHQYMWPYLLHYPGVLALRTSTLHAGRSAALVRQQRHADYAVEMAFAEGPRTRQPWHLAGSTWPMLRVPVLASRLTVVADEALAATLRREHPGVRVRWVPTGVPAADPPPAHDVDAALRVGAADAGAAAILERAVARSRAAGARFEWLGTGDAIPIARHADVILATRWPALGRPLTAALLGAAGGKAVVVAETESVASWPALDPQTWRPREACPGVGQAADPPIVVSIDPRDEEHSLMLALRRLTADAPLRVALGAAARTWWERHWTVDRAASAWQAALAEGAAVEPPPRPDAWPAHLAADGSSLARAILDEFGLAPDWAALGGSPAPR